MRAPRIPIAGFMAFIGLFGVTLAALLAGTEYWASMMLTLALAASGLSLLGRLATRGIGKTAWTGYLIFGAGYLAICVGPWCDVHIMPHLLTTPFIDAGYSSMEYTPTRLGERVWTSDMSGREYAGGEVYSEVEPGDFYFDVAHERGTTSRYSSAQLRPISPDGYRRLCHSALSLWIGLLGSLLAYCVFGVRRGVADPGARSDAGRTPVMTSPRPD